MNLSTYLTQATDTMSALKLTLLTDFKLLDLRLRQSHEEQVARLRLRHLRLKKVA